MKRSHLKNKANKTKHPTDIKNYKKQRNLIVKMNKEAKIQYFNNSDTSNNSKHLWEKCKSYFSNKHAKGDCNIMLLENDKILMENTEIASTFNSFFGSVVDSLDLYEWPSEEIQYSFDNIENIVLKYRNHPSIIKIKHNHKINHRFSLQPVSLREVKNVKSNISSNKATAGEIPVNILKQSEFKFEKLTDCINHLFLNGKFPNCLKEANITPVLKKGDATLKTNY